MWSSPAQQRYSYIKLYPYPDTWCLLTQQSSAPPPLASCVSVSPTELAQNLREVSMCSEKAPTTASYLLITLTRTLTINNILRHMLNGCLKIRRAKLRECLFAALVSAPILCPHHIWPGCCVVVVGVAAWAASIIAIIQLFCLLITRRDNGKEKLGRKTITITYRHHRHRCVQCTPGKHRTNNIHYTHETESLLNQGYMKEALLGSKNPCWSLLQTFTNLKCSRWSASESNKDIKSVHILI